jgi:hypothetical protein
LDDLNSRSVKGQEQRRTIMKRLIHLSAVLVGIFFVVFILFIKETDAGPVPPPYIPCGSTDVPEFHSLRPYQASPCRDDFDNEMDNYCANDLVTKETIVVRPGDGIPGSYLSTPYNLNGRCDGDVTKPPYTCRFEKESSVSIGVDMTDAELPIMGNTQLVPNQVNRGSPQPEQFSYARRVNEYVSWYLNGATYRADEELMDPDEINLLDTSRHIINYSGPIKKLFPRGDNPPGWAGQWKERQDEQGAANRGLRHNQIVICLSGQNQVPCWWNFERERYEDNDGNALTAVRLTESTPESPWLPFSSTEDKLGLVYMGFREDVQPGELNNQFLGAPGHLEYKAEIPAGINEGVQLTDMSFIPARDSDHLYFPHMEENVSLTDLLQQMYVPLGISRGAASHEPRNTYVTDRCDLKDVRWNTGDDLFGEISAPPEIASNTGISGEDMAAVVEYTANFTCTFTERDGVDPDCWDLCMVTAPCPCDPVEDPGNCNLMGYLSCEDYCTDPGKCGGNAECEQEVYTATSLYTWTPKAEELWERTTAGNMSFVNRILPKIGSGGMFDEIKDLPGVTSARYQSTTSGVEIISGEIPSGKSGDRAELFIPHLGGIYEYFLITVQDTLRPYEMNSKFIRGGSGVPGGIGTPGTCSEAPGPYCDADSLAQTGFGSNASNASQICNKESGGYAQALNSSCLTGGTYDLSAGLFQINLVPFPIYNNGVIVGFSNSRCDSRVPGFSTSQVFDIPQMVSLNSGLTSPRWCVVRDMAKMQECISHFWNPVNNINFAVGLSNGGTSFSTHWVRASQMCNIP